MIEAALAGVVAGYAIAIPVGAIAVLIIHTGLTQGLRPGFAAGAGAASADGIYAAAAALGGLAFSGLVEPLIAPLRIVAGLVLVALGAAYVRFAVRADPAQPDDRSLLRRADRGPALSRR